MCVCTRVSLNEGQKKKIQSLHETPENYLSPLLFMSHSDSSAGMQSLRPTVDRYN